MSFETRNAKRRQQNRSSVFLLAAAADLPFVIRLKWSGRSVCSFHSDSCGISGRKTGNSDHGPTNP